MTSSHVHSVVPDDRDGVQAARARINLALSIVSHRGPSERTAELMELALRGASVEDFLDIHATGHRDEPAAESVRDAALRSAANSGSDTHGAASGASLDRSNKRMVDLEGLATYTPKQVADLIGASEWWIRDQAARRRVPHLRLGRAKIVFRRSDIAALEELLAVPVVQESLVDPRDTTKPSSTWEAAERAGLSRRTASRLGREAG